MTLKEQFKKEIIAAPVVDEVIDYWVSELEQIADEFAIGFALWKETNAEQNENGLYYGESRIQVSRHNPITIEKLLEIYKEEKGL